MGRTAPRNRPSWLNEPIKQPHSHLAKTNVGSFLDAQQNKGKGSKSALDLLPGFFQYLGRKNPDFASVKREDISTSDKTTATIYDVLNKSIKKRAKKLVDPKPILKSDYYEPPAQGEMNWQQKQVDNKPQNLESSQKSIAKEEEAEKQQIPATQKPINQDESKEQASSSSSSISDSEFDSPPLIGSVKFQKLKKQLISAIDLMDEKEAELFWFEYHFPTGTLKLSITSKDSAEKL